MLKLKLTTGQKEMYISVEGCTKITDISGKQIHWKFYDPEEDEPKFSYFEIPENGELKILAVSGKVELIEVPQQETILETWEKREK